MSDHLAKLAVILWLKMDDLAKRREKKEEEKEVGFGFNRTENKPNISLLTVLSSQFWQLGRLEKMGL